MIEVVSAVIIRDERIFLQQRDASRDYPFTWECPGGKVEPSDVSLRAALARELREEIRNHNLLEVSNACIFVHVFPELDLRIRFFVVNSSVSWNPVIVDAIGFGWFDLEETFHLPTTPGNEALFAAIRKDKMRLDPIALTDWGAEWGC